MAEPTFLGNELQYVHDVMLNRQLSAGRYVRDFERAVARMSAAQHAVVTTSGTTALHLALLALGLQPGDRVVVPACSYIATANAVRYCGAEPVFVDVDVRTWNASRVAMERAVHDSGAVGAIVVHLYGVSGELPIISGWVLEDSCEGHSIPLSGTAAVFSFYGNKVITCGEGGAVVTNRRELAAQCALLRGQGTSGRRRYVHEVLGYNYRLTDLQAAVGLGQIEKLHEHIERRAILMAVYEEELQDFSRQHRPAGSVPWVMPILVKERDRVALDLDGAGVETRPVFPALHTQPCHRVAERYQVAEDIARDGLLLPLHLGMTEDDVRWVCHTLRRSVRRHNG